LTRELIGNNLQAILGNTDWIYSDNLYPMLQILADEMISKIAASPAYLDATNPDFDQQNNVRQCFIVNLENDIEWSNAFDNLLIEVDSVYLENLGNDTLYAGIGDVKKTIPLTVNRLCKKEILDDLCTLTVTAHSEQCEICSEVCCGIVGSDINKNTKQNRQHKNLSQITFSQVPAQKYFRWS